MRYKLNNSNGEKIKDDFTTDCSSCIASCDYSSGRLTCPLFGDARRIGLKKNEFGDVFGCSDSKDYLNSSKKFRRTLDDKLIGVTDLAKTKKALSQETKRLIHNLTNANGHSIQELYALVPQDILTKDLRNQLSIISNAIKENPDEAAKTFLRIVKNNASMKTEFSVFKKLYDGTSLTKKRHPIKKVVLNLFHPFFQDFSDINIYVSFEENDDYLIFDYESIHVAFYHLVDNATKYSLPNSKIFVTFLKTDKNFSVVIDMTSLRIESTELPKLLEEGFSGDSAQKLKLSGDGIGLSHVTKILALNDAELLIYPKIDNKHTIRHTNGFMYDRNRFEVRFNNYLQQKM